MGLVNGGLINVGSHGTAAATQLALSDGLACFTGSFSGVTNTSIGHNLNSSDLVVEFKDSLGNLLIPDNWSITNPNVIEVDFSPAATGDVTIIACIESGLAPITGGVTSVEGLSGIIDLDSPNGSIDISTSGQVINLNAIFTQASGAVLEQKCRDIDILSGLIGTGGSGSPVDSRPATGVIEPNADCTLDLGVELARWRALYGCSGFFRDRIGVGTSEPEFGIHVSGASVRIEETAIASGSASLGIATNADGLGNVSAIAISYDAGAKTSGINATTLIGVDRSDTTGGVVAGVGILANSGVALAYGMFTGADVNPVIQISANLGLPTTVLVDGIDETADLTTQGIKTTVFVNDDDDLVIGDTQLFSQIDFEVTAGAENNSIKPVFEFSLGIGIWTEFQPLDTTNGFQQTGSIAWRVSDVPGWAVGASSEFRIRITRQRNNLQQLPVVETINVQPSTTIYQWDKDGVVTISQLGVNIFSPSEAVDVEGNIRAAGHLRSDGDCLYDIGTTSNRWAATHACSGIFSDRLTVGGSGVALVGEGVQSVEGLSGVIDIDSPDGTVIISTNGQVIGLTVLPDTGQTSLNGLSGALTLTSPDGSILVGDNGQAIELSGLFTPASGAVLEQKCQDIDTVSGIASAASTSVSLDFTSTSGTEFVMQHDFGSEKFTWGMWDIATTPNSMVIPENIVSSGIDHVLIQLNTPMNGFVNLVRVTA